MFDYYILRPHMLRCGVVEETVFINKKLFKSSIYYKNKKITMICSYLLMGFGLKSFKTHLGTENKMYFPYEMLENFEGKRIIEIDNQKIMLSDYYMKYNIQDVKILKTGYEIYINKLLKFIKDADILKKHHTLGGISLHCFLIKNKKQINLKLNKEELSIAENVYLGGRCEVFANEFDQKKKVLYYDFPGMYNLCMIEDLPDGFFNYKTDGLNIEKPGFYYISMCTESNIPVLPIKNHKLYFVNGKIEGWFWFEEIKHAIINTKTYELNIMAGLVCNDYGPWFKEYAGEIKSYRSEGFVEKRIGKDLINSLYGRLGIGDEIEINRFADHGDIGDNFLKSSKIKQKTKANKLIAAAITSRARIKLHQGILDVIKTGGKVLYCDTDSIFASYDSENKIENKVLGDSNISFKYEDNDIRISKCIFYKPKTYGILFNDGSKIIKCKGFNIDDISFESFYDFLENKKYKQNIIKFTFNSIQNIEIEKEILISESFKRKWVDFLISTEPYDISHIYK